MCDKVFSYRDFNYFVLGEAGNMEIVYAIETSSNVEEKELADLKKFAAATLDYYNMGDLGTSSTKFGLMSFGEKINVVLKDETKKLNAKSAISSLQRENRNQADLLQLLETAESKMFTNGRDTKKLLVIFTKEDPVNFPDSFNERVKALKAKGMHVSFLFVNSDGDLNDVKLLTENLVGNVGPSNELPVVFPDIERIIGQVVGEYLIFFVLCLIFIIRLIDKFHWMSFKTFNNSTEL